MARFLPALIGSASLALFASAPTSVSAQERPPADPLANATPAPKPAAPERPAGGGPGPGPGGPYSRGPGMGRYQGRGGDNPDAEKARQAFQQMTPEERSRWVQRLKEFSDLSPEKKKELFERGEYFRRKMREDVETAIRQSGLNLTDEQKKKFADRYFEERRVIEEELRKQMEELRRPKVEALVEKLKQEFATQAAPKAP